jgi:hypothetical protein
MRMQAADLLALLKTSPELARACTQNGWIDNDTLRFDVLDDNGQELMLAVYFDEVIMEATDCAGDRKPSTEEYMCLLAQTVRLPEPQ